MLIAKLQQFGTDYLPRTLLLVLFITLTGLSIMMPVVFLQFLLITSVYSLVLTSLYYLWRGIFALAPMI